MKKVKKVKEVMKNYELNKKLVQNLFKKFKMFLLVREQKQE